jgi:hypothetical protein
MLAALFLFFNLICTAAPSVKIIDENKDAISLRIGSPLESEEQTHVAGYINHSSHFSFRKQTHKQVYQNFYGNFSAPIIALESSNNYIPDASTLPVPGNHAFLFRYNLF